MRSVLERHGPGWAVTLLAIVAYRIEPSSGPPPAPPRHVSCGRSLLSDETEAFGPSSVARDCPALRVVEPSAPLVAAVRSHVNRRKEQLRLTQRKTAFVERWGSTLYKWELLRLADQFDAILFTDLDVDVFPPSLQAAAVASEWLAALPGLVEQAQRRAPTPSSSTRGSTMLVASPDPFRDTGQQPRPSPINAGVLLLLPPPLARSLEIYEEGLRVLCSPFDDTRGWNLSGSPAALSAGHRPQRVDGSLSAAAIENRHWDFVGADVDQGFLTYMFLLRHRSVARPALALRHRLVHSMGQRFKPWLVALNLPPAVRGTISAARGTISAVRGATTGRHASDPQPVAVPNSRCASLEDLRAYLYIASLPLDEPLRPAPPSACVRAFVARRRALEAPPSVRECEANFSRVGDGGLMMLRGSRGNYDVATLFGPLVRVRPF